MAVSAPPADVTIRPVERADLLSIVRIERSCFDQPWPYTAFDDFVDEPGFLVADDGTSVVGYVVSDVTPNYGNDVGHVKDLAVAAEHRHRGIGRSLLTRALVTLALDGATMVKLEVRADNTAAQSLYRDVGFRVARRNPRYYRDGEDALVMVLDVAEWRRMSDAESG